MMKSNKNLLNLGSLTFGLLSVGTLMLAVTTDYWLFTQEDLDISQMLVGEITDNSTITINESDDVGDFKMVTQQPPVMRILTHSGLWRSCVVYPKELCAIRRATPIIVVSLAVLLNAFAFSTVGNAKGDVKTFIGAVLYIVSALNLAIGVIIYISQVNDEVSHRKKPDGTDGEQFSYHYGWAFFFAGASFMCAMVTAVLNISLYLQRYSRFEDMVQIIPGLEKRGPMSRCVTQDTMETSEGSNSRASSRRSSMRMSRAFSGLPQNPTIIL